MALATAPSRLIATLVWLLVALLAALTIAVVADLPLRQRLFIWILLPGLVLLLSLNISRPRNKGLPALAEEHTPSQSPTINPEQPALAPSTPTRVPTEEEPVEKLSPQQAREWLDAFLVEQQRKR